MLKGGEPATLVGMEQAMNRVCGIYETLDGRGRGVCAKVPVKRGAIVGVYQGDRLSRREGEKREEELGDSEACYVFWVYWRANWWCIDATDPLRSNVTRYINHSRRQDNVKPVIRCVDCQMQVVFVAKRDIDAGEEILFDYGDRRAAVLLSHKWLRE